MTDEAATEAAETAEEETVESAAEAPVEPETDEVAEPAEDEAAEEVPVVDAPAPHPEPRIVGHSVIQDNVSTPGVQNTHTLGDEDDGLLTSTHETVGAYQPPVEDEPETAED